MENFRSIATCEIDVVARASALDPDFVTQQHRYRRSGDVVRWDHVTRGQRPEGVLKETLTQLFFNGAQTTQITVEFPGLERQYSPLQPRGIRCQLSDGMSPRMNDALLQEVLPVRAFAIG
ncbi:MAG: hypothetical protein HYV60_12065, partial [Planctomycetia bacterium]|nr:hypothetical protein [Planctomycetia bacterium]